jgi:hypothetical protein
VFLDSKFERVFGGSDPDYLALLPKDIQPEVEAALEGVDSGFVASCEAAAQFLSGRFDSWDARVDSLKRSGSSVKVKPEDPDVVSGEIDGWLALWRGDPLRAAKTFEKALKKLGAGGVSGPMAFAHYAQAWAEYLCYIRLSDQTAMGRSLNLLDEAAWTGPSSWFTTTLRSAAADLKQRTEASTPTIRRGQTVSFPAYTEAVLEAWESILFEK